VVVFDAHRSTEPGCRKRFLVKDRPVQLIALTQTSCAIDCHAMAAKPVKILELGRVGASSLNPEIGPPGFYVIGSVTPS
jgi:hypothetical protein